MTQRILVVEDNPMNMELVTDLLELGGFQVVQASSAEQGLELAKETQPQLILMDLALPGMDGLEATRVLLDDPSTRGVRVVALTAHAMRGDHERALAAGCVGYITKPIATRSFVKEVAAFLESPPEDLAP